MFVAIPESTWRLAKKRPIDAKVVLSPEDTKAFRDEADALLWPGEYVVVQIREIKEKRT